MRKQRVQVLLDEETITLLEQEAKEKSISISAVCRQCIVSIVNFRNAVRASKSIPPQHKFPSGGIIQDKPEFFNDEKGNIR